jgi:hypothetical protein
MTFSDDVNVLSKPQQYTVIEKSTSAQQTVLFYYNHGTIAISKICYFLYITNP